LHGYYYFNDDIATKEEFEDVVEKYLAFEFCMYIQGREELLSNFESIKFEKIEPLDEKIWKEFFLTELFPSIKRGKRLKKADQVIGNIPYVSSTAMNNGVDNYISNTTSVRSFDNCLTIANSGSVGASFYHEYEFVASDHVTHLKNDDYSKYVYLFISCLTNRLSEKYNFNREINDLRISREKIMLPVDDNDLPDYLYMTQYIKNMMFVKYGKYKILFNKVNI
jgi:hypothetical protein